MRAPMVTHDSNESLTARRAQFVYETCRLEAIASRRPIVPEPLESRDEAFRAQFLNTIGRVCAQGYVTTPEAEHNAWMEAYRRMGWTFGPVRGSRGEDASRHGSVRRAARG
jgi:hypothetical protein